MIKINQTHGHFHSWLVILCMCDNVQIGLRTIQADMLKHSHGELISTEFQVSIENEGKQWLPKHI